jgi:hypothetical protein
MALEFTHGAIQWLTTDILNSTKVISGFGFAPKALRFYWFGIQSNSPTNDASQALDSRRGVGFAVSAASRRCVGSYSQDAALDSNTGVVAADNSVCITVDGNGTVDGRLDISSFDPDGFTLIVDDVVPANITVFYEAWGGDDITVAEIGDIAEPAATGVQNYTVNGFTSDGRDQVVMFAGVQSTAALNTGQVQDSGMCVGFASSTSTTNNITICGNSDDASATMDTDGYIRQGECLSMIVIAGGNPNARATLSAWGTNQFTLNWLARATTNRRYIFLAIKGGGWNAGAVTIAGNTLNSTVNIGSQPFVPNGISMFTRNTAQSTVAVSTVNDLISMGTASSTTSRNSGGGLDENGTAAAEIDLVVQYDSVLSVPSAAGAVQAEYDINSFSINNIQIITDVAGGVATTFLGYLAFGTKIYSPRISSIGHPFII